MCNTDRKSGKIFVGYHDPSNYLHAKEVHGSNYLLIDQAKTLKPNGRKTPIHEILYTGVGKNT